MNLKIYFSATGWLSVTDVRFAEDANPSVRTRELEKRRRRGRGGVGWLQGNSVPVVAGAKGQVFKILLYLLNGLHYLVKL